MTRRRIVVSIVVAGVLAMYAVLPFLAEHRVRTQLAAAGFPDAKLTVESVGWSHLALRDVQLEPGVELGRVEVDRGVNAIWRDVDRVSIKDARVSLDQVRNAGARVRELMASNKPTTGISIDGEVRAERVDLGPYALTRVSVPFAYDERGVAIRGARATLAGGEVTLNTAARSVVVTARGMQLSKLLQPTGRMSGTGTLDGDVVLGIGPEGLSIARGEVRARGAGTLRAPLPGDDRVSATLADFAFDKLSARLGAQGQPDIVVSIAGRGKRNGQHIDLSINVRGARDVAARYLGGDR